MTQYVTGMDLDKLEAFCYAIKESPVVLGTCMPKVVSGVKVKGDISDDQLETIKRLISYLPMHGMIEYANTVESNVTRT